jgi:hypothetical protein
MLKRSIIQAMENKDYHFIKDFVEEIEILEYEKRKKEFQ